MENKDGLADFSLRSIVSAFWRHKIAFIITFLLGIVATFFIIKLRTPVFEASVKMYIKGVQIVDTDFYRGIGPFRVHFTQMAIVTSDTVLSKVVSTLKLDKRPLDYEKKFCNPIKYKLIDFRLKGIEKKLNDLKPKEKSELLKRIAIERLKDNIETELIPNTDIFEIKVIDFDPDSAITIANVVSRAYIIFDQQQQLAELMQKYGQMHPVVQQLSDNIHQATSNLSGKKLPEIEAIGTASVKIIEQATSNFKPKGRPNSYIFLIGFLVSICLGIGIAFVIDFLDKRIKSPDDILKVLDLPVIGSIPRKKFGEKLLLKDAKSRTRYTQFYEELSDQIFVFMKVQNLRSILIISAFDHGANSTIVSNVGYCLSQKIGIRTLIVDANLREPSIHNIYNINEAPGLVELVEGENVDAVINVNSNLSIIQAGKTTENIVNVLDQFNIKEHIKNSNKKFDAIILNGPDIKNFKDSFVLSSHVDGVFIVVHEGKDYIQVINNLILPFKHENSKLIGVILNNRSFVLPKFIYKRI